MKITTPAATSPTKRQLDVAHVIGTMRLEGDLLPPEALAILEKDAQGEITPEESVKQLHDLAELMQVHERNAK
jgi:hypothetical protein